jgi:PAS domain S-box-containing protein
MDVTNVHIPLNRLWGRILAGFSLLLVLLDIIRLFVLPQGYQPVFTDAFETLVAFVGALACGYAAVRSSMLTRGLWVLTAAYLAMLSVADFHDFCVGIRFGEATLLSAAEFIGWYTYVPLALLVFFPASDEGQLRWKWLPILDFAQVAIAVGLAYFRLIYLPHEHAGQSWAEVGTAEVVRNVLISAGLLLRAAADPSRRTRGFYKRIGGAFGTITLLRSIAPFRVYLIGRPAALLAIAIFAVYWTDRSDKVESTQRPIGLRLTLSLFAAATLILVVLLAIDVPAQYRGAMILIAASSAVLFIARSYLAERIRYMTENRLRSSERDHRILFESAIVPIVILEPRSERVLQANPAACELYDIARDDLIGTSLKYFKKDVARGEEHNAELLRTGACRTFQTIHRTGSGREMDVLVSSSLIQYRGHTAILSFTRDMTEARRAEEGLRKAEQEYRTIFEQAIEGIYRTTPDGRFIAANPALARILGYGSAEDLVSPVADSGRQIWSNPEDRRAYLELLEQEGIVHGYECQIVRKDGAKIWASLNSCTVRGPDGLTLYHQGFLEDITKRKKLEQQLGQAQKMEAFGQLAGGVAHDFNNILCAMMVNINVAATYPNLDPRIQEILGDLLSDVTRAADLTRQLLLFSRRSVMDAKLLDLNEVVANLLKLLGRLIGEQVSLRFDRKHGLALVKADAGMIEQVLVNLVVNARDAMPMGGTIVISIENIGAGSERVERKPDVRPGPFICLSVSDTGCGMAEGTLKHIFEPFFTTKDPGKGTGLGLATVDGVVAQHNGWVEVESEVGKGSIFKVFLPAAQTSAHAAAKSEESTVLRGHETILLVEDDVNLRQTIAQALRSLGYGVIEAGNGQDAMQGWHQHHQQIDMLFTDIALPQGLNGLELAHKMRHSNPSLKIILSSSYSEELLGTSRTSSDGMVYLQKPYRIDVMSKVIRNCLDGDTSPPTLQQAAITDSDSPNS